MNDISKKTFWRIIIGLIAIRFLLVFLLMNNVPFTDMQSGGFRPNFGGSYWPDEVHYFELAQSFAKFTPVANVANIGYPLFLAPIVYLTGAAGPEDIAKIVFVIQAFLFFSLAITLTAVIGLEIFKNRKLAIGAAVLFTAYPYLFFGILQLANFSRAVPAFHYQMWINIGADYLSAVLLYLGFYIFIKKYNSGNISLFFASLVGAIIAASALARVANILYWPLIFIILFYLKKYRESIGFGAVSFAVYLPQWIYNLYFFGSQLTYGYRIKELSGHGLGTKIIGDWFSFGNAAIFFKQIWLNLPALIWILPILVFILILGFKVLFLKNKVSALVLGFGALLNIGFYVFFVDAQSQLRYFIPAIPPLIVLFISGIIKIYGFRKFI